MTLPCPNVVTLSNEELTLAIERITSTQRAANGDTTANIYVFGSNHDSYVSKVWDEQERRYVETLKLTGEDSAGPFETENQLRAALSNLESM